MGELIFISLLVGGIYKLVDLMFVQDLSPLLEIFLKLFSYCH